MLNQHHWPAKAEKAVNDALHVVPPPEGKDLAEVVEAARRMNLAKLTLDEVQALRKRAGEHNPATGYFVDAAAALACGLEIRSRRN